MIKNRFLVARSFDKTSRVYACACAFLINIFFEGRALLCRVSGLRKK